MITTTIMGTMATAMTTTLTIRTAMTGTMIAVEVTMTMTTLRAAAAVRRFL